MTHLPRHYPLAFRCVHKTGGTSDNGIGIKEERIFDAKSLGLTGIRERVLLLGGETVISGKPGEGTVVRVTLPIGEGANPNA
jgi:glucose-6-phosphate-specific signal transduction histidine kinase